MSRAVAVVSERVTERRGGRGGGGMAPCISFALLAEREARRAAHGSNLSTKALWLMFNREPAG